MGKLYIVPTPIGNLEDISLRAIKVLNECDFIVAEDTRVTLRLLNHLGIRKELISYHKFNEITKKDVIIKRMEEDDSTVALVSDAGTPCISDPGYILVKQAREASIDVIAVSGASATTMALSISGINTSSFAFYGFLPTKKNLRKARLIEVMNNPIKTFIIYESPKRIIRLLEEISDMNNNTTICLCNDLTKYFETIYYGLVSEVLDRIIKNENADKGEYTVVGYIQEAEKIDQTDFDDELSIESLLVDEMIKKNIGLKNAISSVARKYQVSKNDVYKSSLALKEFIVSEFEKK